MGLTGSSPMLDSALTTQSLLGILSLSLSHTPVCVRTSHPVSLKIIKHFWKIAWVLKNYEDILPVIQELSPGLQTEAEVVRRLKKAWVKIHTCAFVTNVGCQRLETEHLSKVAAGPGASQLWLAQETSTNGRWGSGFHFPTLCELTKFLGGLYPASEPILV